ncbi:MAG: Ribosomal protein L22 [Candidatus Methanohalarchaeum thermophilum]|uniref:Large ribosomal subunit protein uL22 n=1 Tax=Methanohalarchaeum thermophilum TaxID=1903181 RepID=A0A1Q6DX15_METT1|nr:MAG: Ribosomal protein L22 [Candidatus Methanohalarchaeum thermophilum]
MGDLGYSIDPDPKKTSKAMGRELHISPKDSVEICDKIRGKDLDRAKNILEDVINGEKPIPFKKHNKKKGHRSNLENWDSGGYPKKAASEILKTIENAENNAEYKGLDTEKLKIKHIAAHRGQEIEGMTPRAFGRATPSNTSTTHIEVVLEEK